MDHNVCLEQGWVCALVGYDGLTRYTCPCDQYRNPPPHIYCHGPPNIYGYGPMINPNYYFPTDGSIPDTFAPYNLCNPTPDPNGPDVALYNINFQIEGATTSDFSTQEDCEIECDITPSRDELSSSSSTTCEISQCDIESEPENKKKRIRKRKPKRKTVNENVEKTIVREKTKEEITKEEITKEEITKEEITKEKITKEVDKPIKKKKKKKSKKKRCDDVKLLEQLVKENAEAKKEHEIKCALVDICQSSNKILGILQILMTRPDTRCYCENVAYQIQSFLGMEEDTIIRLGCPVVKDPINLKIMTTNLNFVGLAHTSFDNLYTCAQLSDLINDHALHMSNGYLTKCVHLCATIYGHLVNLIEAKVDMSKIHALIEDINKQINWKEEAIKFLGTKLTDVYEIFPTTEWPTMSKINPMKNVQILKDCTWGTLSSKDKCGKCGATKGTVIYSSCCYTRQIFCKCDCDLVNSTVPCQNLYSECIGDVMHIKDLLLSQSFNKEMNVEMRKTLLDQDKTIVPRIVGKFNSEDI